MAAVSYLSPRFQALGALGLPIIGGKLYTYVNKTTLPAVTYRDAEASTPNSNPITLDGRGEAVVFLTPGQKYTFVLRGLLGELIWTQDSIVAPATDDDIGGVIAQLNAFISNLATSVGASLIGFIQTGLGAVYQTVQKKLEGVSSPLDFYNADLTPGNHTNAFKSASVRWPEGFFAPAGDYTVNENIDVPVFSFGGVTITGSGQVNVIDLTKANDDVTRPALAGRRPNQVMQVNDRPAAIPVTVSGVSQGLMFDQYAGVYYMTWDDGSGNVIVRKLDSTGASLLEYTLPGIGHGDSISKAVYQGLTNYLIGGSGATGGLVHVLRNDVLVASLPVNIVDRVGGTLIAVDQYSGDMCAFFFRNANGQLRIAHSVPLADVMNGVAVSSLKNTFTFTLPNDNVTALSMQSLAYYNGDIIIWAGNDSRSGLKMLFRYNKFGKLLESLNVRSDAFYSDVEGNITEPEGLSISKNPITGGCDIHVVKCFGRHLGPTYHRVYELTQGESSNSVVVEGLVSRSGATGVNPALKVVDIPLIFERVTNGWSLNAGTTISGVGRALASNVRMDDGSLGLFFDLYKPYISLIGWSLSPTAGLNQAGISVSWTQSKGGSTSNKNQKITFFNSNANTFISANDAAIINGSALCLTLRVGYAW